MQVTTTCPGITAAAAVAAVQAAVNHATEKGWKINVAVADRSGKIDRVVGCCIDQIERIEPDPQLIGNIRRQARIDNGDRVARQGCAMPGRHAGVFALGVGDHA